MTQQHKTIFSEIFQFFTGIFSRNFSLEFFPQIFPRKFFPKIFLKIFQKFFRKIFPKIFPRFFRKFFPISFLKFFRKFFPKIFQKILPRFFGKFFWYIFRKFFGKFFRNFFHFNLKIIINFINLCQNLKNHQFLLKFEKSSFFGKPFDNWLLPVQTFCHMLLCRLQDRICLLCRVICCCVIDTTIDTLDPTANTIVEWRNFFKKCWV